MRGVRIQSDRSLPTAASSVRRYSSYTALDRSFSFSSVLLVQQWP